MGFLDRLLGRPEQQPEQYPTRQPVPRAPQEGQQPQRTDDEIAVERYQYLLRTAPPETLEKVHTEAFSKLTPEQRDLLFEKLSENEGERPADAQPATLAKAATRQEIQQPGTLSRAFGDQGGQRNGPSFGSMVGSSILGTVAGYVIGSALVSAFMPDLGGATDAGGEADAGAEAESDAGADAGADGGDGWGGDAGADMGGGDFGGGDFGGDFGF